MSMQDQEKIIIDIILESDFFPNIIKNEIRNFRNWGYKLECFEIERDLLETDYNNQFLIRVAKETLFLIWDQDTTEILLTKIINGEYHKFSFLNILIKEVQKCKK